MALIALGALGIVLVATAIRGEFTVDESNYLVTVVGLRHGTLTVPGTANLTPSVELAYFDPTSRARRNPTSPIGSTAPPLYAFLALPFSFFGWRGLVALNTLAYLATIVLVFVLAKRHAARPSTPWIAAVTMAVGGYSIEYAQAVWPHALSAALCLAAFWLAALCRSTDRPRLALLAGLVAGLAIGVRYQNLVLAAAVGLGLLLWSSRRVAAAALFGAGCLVPLAACSYINHVRLGSWNPVSKGSGYFALGEAGTLAGRVTESARVLYAKVVDFSTHPVPNDTIAEASSWWERDPKTGVVIFYGGIKKALLQSSPWLALAFVGLALAFRRSAGGDVKTPQRNELRSLALVIAAVLLFFAYAGFARHDGISFNQRYFIELVPLGAVAAAWTLERRRFAPRALLLGAEIGIAIGLLVLLLGTETTARQRLEMMVPLAIAAALLLAFAPRATERFPRALTGAFAATVAWAAVIHVGEDLRASRRCRTFKRSMLAAVEPWLPNGSVALIGNKPWSDVLAVTLLNRDGVIADTWVDRGASVSRLAGDLVADGRRTFVLAPGMSRAVLADLRSAYTLTPVRAAIPLPAFEVTAR
jgi:hypothetical protein